MEKVNAQMHLNLKSFRIPPEVSIVIIHVFYLQYNVCVFLVDEAWGKREVRLDTP